MAFLDDIGVECLAADIKELADNTYVNRDGDTMTGNLYFNGTDVVIAADEIEQGTPPSSSNLYDTGVQILDRDGNLIGQMQGMYTTDDKIGAYLGGSRDVNGSQVDNKIRFLIDGSGNRSITVSDSGVWRDALGINNTVKEVTPSAVNVSSATDTTLCNSGSLSAGTYIIMFRASFASNSSGRRAIFLATSNSGSTYEGANVTTAPANGAATQLEGVKIVTLTSATTFYLRAYHNAGSSLSTTGRMEILKIH